MTYFEDFLPVLECLFQAFQLFRPLSSLNLVDIAALVVCSRFVERLSREPDELVFGRWASRCRGACLTMGADSSDTVSGIYLARELAATSSQTH